MALHRLLFDTANPAESANVGAYLRSSDGTLLTHTTVGADEALDINLVQSVDLTVTATDLDIRDLTAATDNVEAWLADGAGTALTSTLVGADQALDVNVVALTAADVDIRDLTHVSDSVRLGDGTTLTTVTTVGADNGLDVNLINTSIAVTATDLDIRDLTSASDSVRADLADGAGTALTSTLVGADQALDVNLVQSVDLTVTATDLDIRDLTAASDSVAAWTHDGTGTAITSTTGHLDVNIASSDIELDVEDDLADTAIATASETVTTTSGALNTSDLANRRFIWMYNNGNKEVFVGPSGVTTADGFPIWPGALLEARIGPNVAIHAVSAAGSQDIRVLQAS